LKFIWFLVFVLLSYPSLAVCDFSNTPKIIVDSSYELWDGINFFYDVDSKILDDVTKFGYAHMDSNLESFYISKLGLISFTPTKMDVGEHKIMILAYTSEDCFDSEIIIFKVYERPNLIVYPNPGKIELKEGEGITFNVTSDTDFKYEWLLDNKRKTRVNTFGYIPGYNDSGFHDVELIAKTSKNLTEKFFWNVSVQNVNRPPVLYKEIPSVSLGAGTSVNLFDLNDYFIDPDDDDLSFSFQEPDVKFNSPLDKAEVKVKLIEDIIRFETFLDTGFKFFKFIATDSFGESAESNNVKIEVYWTLKYITQLYCGDGFCSDTESCTLCPADCGSCENVCVPEWVCDDWDKCQPIGIQTRACNDIVECDLNIDRPEEVKNCTYQPRCNDGILNQGEDKIDCGGPCRSCPACFDNVKNQGEDKIDCGGPCKPCDACFDNVKNQDESDIDCGGSCDACSIRKFCNTKLDCVSEVCRESRCVLATCFDNIKNQNEVKVDCGGPCSNCPTCSDDILNQNEVKVDCGGPCSNCPTCDDNIKNQDEFLKDCGGPCDFCSLKDYYNYLEFKYFFALMVLFMIIALLLFKFSKNIVFRPRDRIFSFFESESHLNLLIFLNRLSRLFRFKKTGMDKSNITSQLINDLENIESRDLLVNSLSQYFAGILSINENSSYDEIYKAIRTSKAPIFVKMMFSILLSKFWLIKTENEPLSTEIIRVRNECIHILEQLKKDL